MVLHGILQMLQRVTMGSDTNKEYGCTIYNNYGRKNSDLSNIRKQIKAFDTDNNDISDYVIISGNLILIHMVNIRWK